MDSQSLQNDGLGSKKVTGREGGRSGSITAYFYLEGMSCPSCAGKIEQALSDRDGVQHAKVDFDRRQVRVTFNPEKVGEKDLKETVDKLGYRLVSTEVLEEEKLEFTEHRSGMISLCIFPGSVTFKPIQSQHGGELS